MRKLIVLAVAGLAVAGLTLATPAVSRADHRHHRRGGGFHLDIGGFHVDYNRGRGGHHHGGHYGHGGYYSPGYGGYSGGGYGGYYSPGYRGSGYGGYYGHRPTIVHPTESHWTPYRGWHEHGHIHVPHRGHYHTYRY